MTPEALLSALNWRYATKQFDAARTIPDEHWDALEESLVLTPSSFGLQPWKFLVVEDPAVREELKPASWGQGQVTDASHLVILAARTDNSDEDINTWIARLAETQNKSPEEIDMYAKVLTGFNGSLSPEQRHAWNSRQVYIALGQLMTSAAVLGIDTCPLEGIDTKAYDSILGLEGSGFATAVACALGYRAETDKYATTPKARFDRGQIIEHVVAE
nr:NAD(P)H-dependent oxidoreductase [Verrucomicrobiota bacterium JB025]